MGEGYFMVQNSFVTKHSISTSSVGSTEAQITFLTNRVIQLSYHLTKHKKDYSSQRGLRKLLGRRKNLLDYLSREDAARYQQLINQLKIRGGKKTS
jgi:small subunit ribosomal protein S15